MTDDLVQILKEKSHPPKIRFDAILAVVEACEPAILPVFEEILNDPTEHPDVRSAVALALGKIGAKTEFSTHGIEILQILQRHAHDMDSTVRNYVIQALGSLGREEVIPVLIEALKDKNNTVFASAAQALGGVGQRAIPYLIRLLSEGADDARCVAAWQLGELCGLAAVPSLLKIVQGDPNPEVVALSIWALGEIGAGPRDVMDVLKLTCGQSDPDIRLRAEKAFAKIVSQSN